ncbi:MAG: transketolase C-terminal domain-containing protein [Nitrospinaceae bacterium]|nr:transketolase C-terminal domain-containing protein [Nitrospinaceae bacterium]
MLKDGSDIAILAYGHTVDGAMMVSNMFEKEGISVAVINARFAKPVDKDLIVQYAKSTRCLITVEEHSLKGGFGSAVLEALQEEKVFSVPVKCIGLGDIVLEHGAPGKQRKDLKLDPEGMFDTIGTFYGSVAENDASGNGKKWLSSNGKKMVVGNGNNSNLKKNNLNIKQNLND